MRDKIQNILFSIPEIPISIQSLLSNFAAATDSSIAVIASFSDFVVDRLVWFLFALFTSASAWLTSDFEFLAFWSSSWQDFEVDPLRTGPDWQSFGLGLCFALDPPPISLPRTNFSSPMNGDSKQRVATKAHPRDMHWIPKNQTIFKQNGVKDKLLK